MLTVDLNCDMGESSKAAGIDTDTALMKHVSSVNIACGFHAGDSMTMRKTVDMAIQMHVAIGAHPGFNDLKGFGRREMPISPKEVFDIVVYQISKLTDICKVSGVEMHHVKPHGALYNQASKDRPLARAIVEAICCVDKRLIVYALSGSCLISEAAEAGLKTASEVFADRTYQPDGSLTPRSDANALIADSAAAAARAVQMVERHVIAAVGGHNIAVNPETICIHGDGENAVDFARSIRSALEKSNISVMRPSASR